MSKPPVHERGLAIPVTFVLVVACAVVLFAPGLSLVARSAIGVGAYVCVWVIVRLRRPRRRPVTDIEPTPEYLERLDRSVARQEEEEYAATGEGLRAYERLLGELLALAGRDVVVVVGSASGGCWRPLARLTGRLRGGHSTHVPDEPERMAFYVGTGAFYLDRERFERGLATYRLCEDGALSVEDRDGDSFRLSRAPHRTEDHHARRH